jgi:hypothetical protein
MKLYLVINVEDSRDHFIINITTDFESAYRLANRYKANFGKANLTSEGEDIIVIEEIDTTVKHFVEGENVLFDMYEYQNGYRFDPDYDEDDEDDEVDDEDDED